MCHIAQLLLALSNLMISVHFLEVAVAILLWTSVRDVGSFSKWASIAD